MSRDWTSRERVQAALAHQEPDRVPIGLEIAPIAYGKLRTFLGFPPQEQTSTYGWEPVPIEPGLANFLSLDLTRIRLRPIEDNPPAPGAVFLNEWQIGRFMPESGSWGAAEPVVSPLASARIEDLRDFHWPDPENPTRVLGLETEAAALFRGSDLALLGSFGGSILQTTRDLRGETQWNRDLEDNPDFVCALLNRIAGIQIALDEAGLRACGPYLSILEIREVDYGKPGRWHFPVKLWREIIRPVIERRVHSACQALKRWAPQARLLLYAPMPRMGMFADLVAAGADLFGPLQPGIPDLYLSTLKRTFEDKLSFWGGLDGGALLETGSENDVREAVKASLRRFSGTGGYILAPAQVVHAGAQPQNIIAMCETVKVYGRYPAAARRP